MRFSPSGALLAVGAIDGHVYLFDAAQGFLALGVLDGGGDGAHAAAVTALDWAAAPALRLRSGCAGGTVRVWDVAARKLDDGGDSDGGWASASVTRAADAAGVNVEGGAEVLSADVSPEGDVVACGASDGGLRLFRYPARHAGAGHRLYGGHGAAVSGVGFSWDDRFVATIGADGVCLVWRHWNERGERELSECDSDAEEETAARQRHRESVREQPKAQKADAADATATAPLLRSASSVGALGAAGESERAEEPWRTTIREAGLAGSGGGGGGAAPSARLVWVHGYRGHDCVQNVHLSAAGEAVYPAAALVVLVGTTDSGKRTQRFFRGHTDDVLCLAAHPERRIFASGQKAFVRGGHSRSAPLLVWDSTALPAAGEAPLATLTGVHESAVTSVAFSADGGRLVSAGLDAMHTVALWDWQKGECLLRTASSPRAVRGVGFLLPRAPTDDGADGGAAAGDATGGGGSAEARVVVCGEKELRFGTACQGLRWRKAVFGAQGELQTLPCVAVNSDGRVLTGTRRGELYVWQGCRLWRRLPAHEDALQAVSIAHAKEGETAGFATGGADGVVLLWAARYERLRAIDLNALCRRGGLLDAFGRPKLLPPARGVRVSAVCWDVGARRLLVGTQHNEVVRLDLADGGGDAGVDGGADGAIQTTLLTQGHGGGRVRGPCVVAVAIAIVVGGGASGRNYAPSPSTRACRCTRRPPTTRR